MITLFFNDASITPIAADFFVAWSRIEGFIKTYKARPEDIFENRICSEQYLGEIQLAENLDLQSFCKDPRGRTLGPLLLGLTKHPFIDSGSRQETEFLKAEYRLIKGDERLEAFGITAAFLNESIGIGFVSEPFWEEIEHQISVRQDGHETLKTVLCASCPAHFSSGAFEHWREEHFPRPLEESPISPAQKRIHLRDDHGKDVLMQFAERLVKSPYVVEILNSIAFSPAHSGFIKATHDDGLFELVLHWTDRGLGLLVKTTGRNLSETRRIAAILEKEFGQ